MPQDDRQAFQSAGNSIGQGFAKKGLSGGFGSGGGFGSSMSSFGPGFWAALIMLGKRVEHNNPDSPLGKGLLAGLGPSIAQIREDPKGMGLPTLAGLPFLTPFTGSKKARETKPEWDF